ncbi:class I SAM-dependent methyltransferase [Mycolicibacterium sp. S2-37]|uniref:SAM-dependent methyltransferase n=1 Tax=Mycolicibacterium sp. S2-37 TaxID=2810297 RepID=UPI001A94FBAC|nr:class I SAM-dependent methyltransferase [Mycolicibacterium sp. S2-37]MBO0678584.1 class I SAM-dependent methyltransferase [Mycolicibacterium sp. S2-37]
MEKHSPAQRSDDDRWDLATSVGATATMVATSRALATRDADALIDDPFAEPLVRAVGMEFFTQLLDGHVPAEDPSYDPRRSSEHMAVRTRFYDDFFVNAVRGGIRQMVILASGLDTRAYRLPWPADATLYEVDLSDVLEFKSRTLTGLSVEPGVDRRAVAADLRDDWPAAVRAAGFDPSQPTAWSAEGLLVYLPATAQDALFDRITGLSAPGSQLACEYVPDMSVFGHEELRTRFERSSINIADLVYQGERNHVPDYLDGLRWHSRTRSAEQLYVANGLDYPEGVEFALFADVTYLSATLDG